MDEKSCILIFIEAAGPKNNPSRRKMRMKRHEDTDSVSHISPAWVSDAPSQMETQEVKERDSLALKNLASLKPRIPISSGRHSRFEFHPTPERHRAN